MTITHASFRQTLIAARMLDEQWGAVKYVEIVLSQWAIDDKGVHWIGSHEPWQPVSGGMQ